jgi:hypothetical protein
LIAAGCNIQSGTKPISTLTIVPPLNPYQSTTETPTPPTPTIPLPTDIPIIPTPTPFIHIVQQDETLYWIAVKYNVSLDRLVSANPGLDSSMLSVGTEVLIPLIEEENSPPTPTPYPLLLGSPHCFPTTAGDLYCYVLVTNNQNISLENISLAFNLYNEDQELVESQIAFAPLNTLFSDQSFPMGILIPDTQVDQNRISTTLLTAYPSNLQDPLVIITDYSLEFSPENTVVQVKGDFEILEESLMGRQVWIVGVGYNQGQPVALRKWIETDREQSNPYSFEFLLYSLGPEIDQVQLFSELH